MQGNGHVWFVFFTLNLALIWGFRHLVFCVLTPNESPRSQVNKRVLDLVVLAAFFSVTEKLWVTLLLVVEIGRHLFLIFCKKMRYFLFIIEGLAAGKFLMQVTLIQSVDFSLIITLFGIGFGRQQTVFLICTG
ncbi:hypothetical protein QQP08_027318 [Theobroma cacao]|nr:hypothetical protein QQP08_027318 [Theobroma cacao]